MLSFEVACVCPTIGVLLVLRCVRCDVYDDQLSTESHSLTGLLTPDCCRPVPARNTTLRTLLTQPSHTSSPPSSPLLGTSTPTQHSSSARPARPARQMVEIKTSQPISSHQISPNCIIVKYHTEASRRIRQTNYIKSI